MAINQSLYNRLEQLARSEFLTIKGEAIKRIVTEYAGAIEYVNGILIALPEARAGDINQVLIKINQAISDTQSGIEQQFMSQLYNVNRAATEAVLRPLVAGKVPITENFLSRLKIMPEQIAKAQFQHSITSAQAAVIGAKDQVQLTGVPLSDRIWSKDKRLDILSTVKEGLGAGDSPYKIADQLKEQALTGNIYNNSYRLAYTESTYNYNYTKTNSARAWNDDPNAMFQIAIEQYLSAAHMTKDICDELAGTYSLDGPIAAIGRHPGCECGSRQVIVTSSTRFKSMPKSGGILSQVDASITEKRKALEAQGDKMAGYKTGQTSGQSNARFNYITQNLKGNDQKQALQALADSLRPDGNTIDKTIVGTLKTLYSVTPNIANSKSNILTY